MSDSTEQTFCIFKFACYHCRLKEVKRCFEIDELANKGKRLLGKQKTKLDPNNFIRQASEVIMLKNTQLEYGSLLNKDSDDSDYPENENVVSPDDGWKMKCSVCGEYSKFSRGIGNI